MHQWPAVPAGRCGVFTLSEALAAGATVEALRYAVETGALRRLRRGCFAPAGVDLTGWADRDLDLARRTVAATLASRETRASHLGAALLSGLPTWAVDPRACVTTRRDCALRGIHVHHALPRPGHFGVIGGVPVTSPERTIVDIAREYGVESGLVTADAALRQGVVREVDLADVVDELGYDLDVSAARQVLALADGAAESPLESRSRWQMHVHRVPPPLTQVEINTRGGRFLGRTDFYWPAGVVGEVDGNSKYTSPDVLIREKWRQEGLEAAELRTVRWGAVDLRGFGPTAARLLRALQRAQANPAVRGWVAVHPDLEAA